jgi:hypothetical protein
MKAAPLGFLRITISDPAEAYDDFYVGSFLDSEGNKLWFCSPVEGI